jgi:hypothetical protein
MPNFFKSIFWWMSSFHSVVSKTWYGFGQRHGKMWLLRCGKSMKLCVGWERVRKGVIHGNSNCIRMPGNLPLRVRQPVFRFYPSVKWKFWGHLKSYVKELIFAFLDRTAEQKWTWRCQCNGLPQNEVLFSYFNQRIRHISESLKCKSCTRSAYY